MMKRETHTHTHKVLIHCSKKMMETVTSVRFIHDSAADDQLKILWKWFWLIFFYLFLFLLQVFRA